MQPWKIMEMKVHGQKSHPALGKHFQTAHYLWAALTGIPTSEVWAYSSPRCVRPPEKKMREKAGSVSFRQETTIVNYPVQSCTASGTQTSSLPSSATDSPFGSFLNQWENQPVGSQSRFPFHKAKVKSCSGRVGYIYFAILFYWRRSSRERGLLG